MATKKSQRIGIWIIAIVMSFGTIGMFFLPIITSKNDASESAEMQKMLDELNNQQTKQTATAEPLDGFAAEPFDAAAVTELGVEILREPTGEIEATPTSTVTANYFGWTSDGKIFDSSKKDGTATPIPFGLDSVIKGWTEGLTGARAGGVYRLVIPAEKAYGSTDNGDGRPFGPLTFIVEVTDVK